MATEGDTATLHTATSSEGGTAEGGGADNTEGSSSDSQEVAATGAGDTAVDDSGLTEGTEEQGAVEDLALSSTSQPTAEDGAADTVRGNSAATIAVADCLIESSKDISYIAFLTDGAETDKLEGINATTFDLTGYTAGTVRVKSGTTVQTFTIDCATTDTDGDETDTDADDGDDTDDADGDDTEDTDIDGDHSEATITVTDCLIESSKDISYVAFLTDGTETDKLEGINATTFDLTGYTADTVRVKSGTTVQTFTIDCATTDTDGDETDTDTDTDTDDGDDTDDADGDDTEDTDIDGDNSEATITVAGCLIESSKDISYVAFLIDGAETDKLEGINATTFDLTGYTADTVRVKSGTTVQTFTIDCAEDTTGTDSDDEGDDTDETDDTEGDDTTDDEGDDTDGPGNSEATVTLTGCLIESTKDISYIGFWSNGQEIHRLETVGGESYDLADYASIGDIDHIHVKSGTTLEQFDIDCDGATTGTDGDDTTDDDGDDGDDGDNSEATITVTDCLIESSKDISYVAFLTDGAETDKLEGINATTFDLTGYTADTVRVKSGTTVQTFTIDCAEDTTGTDSDDEGDDTDDTDDEGDDTDDTDDTDDGDDEGDDTDDTGNSEATVTLTGCLIESTKDISYIGFWSNGQEIHRLETVGGESYDLADYASIGDIDHIHVKSGTTLEQFDIDCDGATTGTDGDDTTDDDSDDADDTTDDDADNTTDDETTGTDDTDDDSDDTTGDADDDSGDTTGDADHDRSPIDDRSSGAEDDSDDVDVNATDDNRSPIEDLTEDGDALPAIPALGPVLHPVDAAGGPAEGVEGGSAEGTVADSAGPVEPAGDLPYTGAPPLALLGLLVMAMASALRVSTRRTA